MEATPNSGHRNCRKPSRGRQKIEIKKVEQENSRYVCFSKRKTGIFKKAVEISTLCGAEIAVIIFSEHQKVFCFGEPSVDKLIDQFLGTGTLIKVENRSSSSSSGSNKSEITEVEGFEYSRSIAMNLELKNALKIAENNQKILSNNNGEGFWWDTQIESMGKEELEGFKESLEELKKNVMNRIETISKDSNSASDESRIINQFIDNTNNQNDFWSNYSVYGSGLSSDFFSFNNLGGSF